MKKHVQKDLPQEYRKAFCFQVMEELETLRELSRLEILITAVMILIGVNLVPVSSFVEREKFLLVIVKGILAVGSVIVYLGLHEYTHIMIMHLFGAKTAKIKMDSSMVCTSCEEYFDRFAYFLVLFSPLVLWGIVLALVCAVIPQSWFWVSFPILIANFAGASSDMFAAYQLIKIKGQVLVKDEGIVLTIYEKEKTGSKK